MVKKILGLVVATVMLLVVLGLTGCKPKEDDNLEWTNDNAVYVFIKSGFESKILSDIEGSFKTLTFKKVYATEKSINDYTPLVLLFILHESGAERQQDFIDLLRQDERVNHASVNRDLPFDTVDTRRIESAKDTIAIGETLTLMVKGNINSYIKPFGFEGFFVKPVVNKTYTVADFPQVDLKSVEASENGWIYLELAKEGYFEVIKAMNALSRLSMIDKVLADKSENTFIPPAKWEISDTSVAVFESAAGGGYPTAIIKGVKTGKVTIDFDGVRCEITVT